MSVALSALFMCPGLHDTTIVSPCETGNEALVSMFLCFSGSSPLHLAEIDR